MAQLNVDSIIFVVFLLANILIGLKAADRVKTLRDYAIGFKNFSTGTMTSTIVSTWVGGGFMFYALQNIYTDGLLFIIPNQGGTLCLLFTGQVLAMRMGEFMNNLSVAEAMGNLYTSITVRIVTAISGILQGIAQLAIQFQVMSRILTFLFGVEGKVATVVAAAIVIFYSAFGGVRSVTITDVFQFIAFSIFIPILALIVWKQIKDPAQVGHTLANHPMFHLKTAIGWNKKSLSALCLMLYYTTPGFTPAIFQRVSMARDLTQVKHSFTWAAIFRLLMVFSITWIAILLLVDNPNLNPKQLMNHIIDHYGYTGLKGLIAVGIASMAMSTADSVLNAAAVLAVNDIIRPLRKEANSSLLAVRLFSLLLGCLGMLLALKTTDLLELLLIAGGFWMPIVTVPLLLAIFGFRSSSRAVLMGMAAGFTVASLGRIFNLLANIDPLIPGMIANLLVYMGTHYGLKEKGGWVGIKVKAPLLAAQQRRRENWKQLLCAIRNPQLYEHLKKSIPSHDIIYPLCGIYIIGATYSSFYTIPHVEEIYTTFYNGLAQSVLVVVAMFITYPAWPPTFKSDKFMVFAWPIGMLYTLFLVGTMLLQMSGFHQVQSMIFLLNLVITALLMSWPIMLLLATLGSLLGYALLSFYYDASHINHVMHTIPSQLKVIYATLLLSSFLLTIFRLKQKKVQLAEKNKYLVSLNQEHSKEFSEVLQYREQVLRDLQGYEQRLIDQTAANYLRQVIYRTVDYLRLKITPFNLEQCIAELSKLLKLQDLPVPDLLIQKNTTHQTIQADLSKLKKLLLTSITFIHQHNPLNKPIIITIDEATLGHLIDDRKDYIRKIHAIKFTISTNEEFLPTQDLYMIDQINLISHINKQQHRQQLIEIAKIIDAHYGYADFDIPNTQVFVIPINLREVRGEAMELLREPTQADPTEFNHPTAIYLEKELFTKLKSVPEINLEPIQKALETIKQYHAKVKRKSGEPFFTHPIHVALILLDYCQDQNAVIAALLHDTVEDTSLSLNQIRQKFGATVTEIVAKLTSLEEKRKKYNLDQRDYISRFTNADDKRIPYIKLADVLHNMRTIQAHPSLDRQKKIAKLTLNIFVAVAKQLDLDHIAKELQDISLQVLAQNE